jgi:flagellar basal-body rod protein FlgC
MDYRAAFQISASGMTLEKARLDVTSMNLANVHSTRAADGKLFRPMRVIAHEAVTPFGATFESLGGTSLKGVQLAGIEEIDAPPRNVYEPGHPQADEKGFVAYPAVDQVGEMVNVMTAVRAYEANVIALNAAKAMSSKAIEIGGGS